MKRGEIVTVFMQGPIRQYGCVSTSSLSAIRETMHEALDIYIDELGAELAAAGPSSLRSSPLSQVRIEARA